MFNWLRNMLKTPETLNFLATTPDLSHKEDNSTNMFLKNNKIRIRHFYQRDLNGRKVRLDSTVATQIHKLDPNLLKVSMSVCSDEDHPCKATGRDIAIARLLSGKRFVYMTLTELKTHLKERTLLEQLNQRLGLIKFSNIYTSDPDEEYYVADYIW